MSNLFYEQLQKESDGTIQKLEWVSVKDGLPGYDPQYRKNGYSIDCMATDGENIFVGFFDKIENIFLGRKVGYDLFDEHKVTHWMPIPKPPEVRV